MGLFDTFLGRTKPVKANLDALFSLPTAALTLQSAGGLVTSGHAGVCWKPPAGQDAEDLQTEVSQLVGDGFTHTQDSFGYGWLLLPDPDLDDLVTQAHMANSTLSDAGGGPSCCARCWLRARARRGRATLSNSPRLPVQARHLLSLRRRRHGKERRDTELELRIRSMLGDDLPVESDLSRWFPMWDLPVGDVPTHRVIDAGGRGQLS